jgi:hypothetical protein
MNLLLELFGSEDLVYDTRNKILFRDKLATSQNYGRLLEKEYTKYINCVQPYQPNFFLPHV